MKNSSDRTLGFLFVLPAFIFIVVIVAAPLFYSLALSFSDYSPIYAGRGFRFAGLKNYMNILSDLTFWSAAGRTLYFTIVSVGLECVLGMVVALLLNMEFRGRAVVRSLILIPWAIPTVVNGTLWKWIYDPNYGVLNGFLAQSGIIDSYRTWLGTPFAAMNAVIAADVWNMTPLVALFLLAGLQAIPHEIHEAAKVDGATSLLSFLKITLPFLKPTILIVLVIRTMAAFRVFDIIYVLTHGGPANGTQVLAYLTYQQIFEYQNFGLGAAYSYLMALCILLMAVIYIKALYTEVEY